MTTIQSPNSFRTAFEAPAFEAPSLRSSSVSEQVAAPAKTDKTEMSRSSLFATSMLLSIVGTIVLFSAMLWVLTDTGVGAALAFGGFMGAWIGTGFGVIVGGAVAFGRDH